MHAKAENSSIEKRYILPQGVLVTAGLTPSQTFQIAQREALCMSEPVLGPRNYDVHQLFPDQTDALEADGRVLSLVQDRLRRELRSKNVMWTRHRRLPEFIFCLACKSPVEVRQCRRADDRSIALLTERKRIGKLIAHALMFTSIQRPDQIPEDEIMAYESDEDLQDAKDLKRPITMAMHSIIVDSVKEDYEKLVSQLREQIEAKTREVEDFKLQVASLNDDLLYARINEKQAIDDRRHFEGKYADAAKEIRRQDEKVRELGFELRTAREKYQIHLYRSLGFFKNIQRKHELAMCFERWENKHILFQMDTNKAEFEAKRMDEIDRLRQEITRTNNVITFLNDKIAKHEKFRKNTAHRKLATQEISSLAFCFRFWRRNLRLLHLENANEKLTEAKEELEGKFRLTYRHVKDMKKEEVRMNDLVKEFANRVKERELEIAKLKLDHKAEIAILNAKHAVHVKIVVEKTADSWARILRQTVVTNFVQQFARNIRLNTRVAGLQAFLFAETRQLQTHEDDPVPYRGRLRVVSREKGRLCEACERQIVFYSRPLTGGSTRPETRETGFRLSYSGDDKVEQQWRLS